MKGMILKLLTTFMVVTATLGACGTTTTTNNDANANTNANTNDNTNDDSANTADEFISIAVGQSVDATTFDIHYAAEVATHAIASQMYETLVTTDEDNNIQPGLAEEWAQIDDTTTYFKLLEGVYFHNGEELKASDVKFTLDRMLESPTVAHILGPVSEINVLSDYEVEIVTSEPFGPLIYHLTHSATSIMNEKAVTEAGEDYGTKIVVGTGPFIFENWMIGDHITLVKNPNYYHGPADVDEIIFKIIPEQTNLTIGLETGELDIAYDVLPIDKERIVNDSSLAFIEEESFATNFVHINCNKITDVNVRQALNYATNKDDIVTAVYEGNGSPANSPLAPSVFGHNPDQEGYEYDLEKAAELLAEAGYSEDNPLEFEILTPDDSKRVQIATILQEQFRQIGINATITSLEWGAFLDAIDNGEHDLAVLGWTASTGDANYGLYPVYHGDSPSPAGNSSYYNNSEVSALLDKAQTSTDQDERLELYHEAQAIIMEDAPMIWTTYTTLNVATQDYIKGFELNPTGRHNLYTVYIDN